MKIKQKATSLVLALAMAITGIVGVGTINAKASSNQYASDYINWVDLCGYNHSINYSFTPKIRTDYTLKVYRDSSLIRVENYASNTINLNSVRNGDKFDPGYILPTQSATDTLVAPTGPDRLRFDIYATINGSDCLIYSTGGNHLLEPGFVYLPATPICPPNPCPNPNPNPKPCPTNHAPVVDSFTPDKTSVNPGEQVDIKALFHDADGDAMKLYFTGANSDNFVYSNTAGVNTPNYEYRTDDVITAPTAPGTYTYKVKANDGTVDSNIVSATITVNAPTPTNHAPVVDSYTPDKSSVNPGEQVDIKALYHDADGDAMNVYFTGANNSNFVFNNTAGANTPNYEYTTDDIITAPTAPGTYTYQVKVNDGKVDSNVGSATITVNSPAPTNHAPVVDSYTADRTTVNAGDQVNLKAMFHDPDGDAMNLYFTGANNSNFAYDSSVGSSSPNYEYTTYNTITAPAAAGTYTYQVKANDGKVDSNIGTVTITVNAPNPNPDPTPKDYLNWIDLGGCNGQMFYYFMPDKVGSYTLNVYRDGILFKTQNATATSTTAITRFTTFNPGFILPIYPNRNLAPDITARMKFDLYVNLNGKQYLLTSDNEKNLLEMGHTYFN